MRIMIFLLTSFFLHTAFAQHSKREDDIFFRKYLVRSVDMKEKANGEIFGKQALLIRLLLDAYCSGQIKGYRDPSLAAMLSCEEYEQRLPLLSACQDGLHPAEVLHILEIGEYLVFDKHTSDFYFDMESLTLFISPDQNARGIQEPLISFSYPDCKKIFLANKSAVSMNPLKNGRNINYADVFLIRLFNSTIVKIGHADDPYIDQACATQMSAFLTAKNGENKLTEYLYKLYHPE
jgi:hypothetical protein